MQLGEIGAGSWPTITYPLTAFRREVARSHVIEAEDRSQRRKGERPEPDGGKKNRVSRQGLSPLLLTMATVHPYEMNEMNNTVHPHVTTPSLLSPLSSLPSSPPSSLFP